MTILLIFVHFFVNDRKRGVQQREKADTHHKKGAPALEGACSSGK